MNTRFLVLFASVALSLSTLAQSTAFTYQGRLNHSGIPATGLYEITFTLYDSATSGNVISTPITVAPVPVTNGLFTASLDFSPNAFTGAPRWLELSVTVYGSDQLIITLAPRQPITAAPYALHAYNAANLMSFSNAPVDIKVNGRRALRLEYAGFGAPNVIAGSEANLVLSGTVGATISGGALNYDGFISSNYVGSDFGTVGGGVRNSAIGLAATVAGGWNNVSTGYYATVSGGKENTSATIFATVSGGFRNNSISNFATISGGRDNVSAGDHTTIGGGFWNRATNRSATVAGGEENIASGFGAVVAGGFKNVSKGNVSAVAGGVFNTGGGHYATVAGGGNNWSYGEYSAISGGQDNKASNTWSSIPGGFQNVAAGVLSFAAGRRAHALHDGAFVWADSTPGGTALGDVFASTGNDQFLVRANGGVGINTNDPAGAALNVAGTVRAAAFESGDQTLELKAGTRPVVRLESIKNVQPNISTNYSVNVIAGVFINSVAPDVKGATISGGGERWSWTDEYDEDFPNRVTDNFGTVSGGAANTSGYYATVSGGLQNTSSGGFATVSGGALNWSSGYAAVISGGDYNVCAGHTATIGGGGGNTASNTGATVPGGFNNAAGGLFSFAAGQRAQALHDGAFVWGDLSEADVTSTSTNEFTARATGGVRFITAIDTNGDPTAGVSLTPGSGSWSSLSDRNAKKNFTPADPRATLDKVAALPIATWNYKSQDNSIRHIGPTAQDFHAAFGVGENDRTITTVDADGVALAAIQGLNQKLEHELKTKDVQIRQLQADLAEVKQCLFEFRQGLECGSPLPLSNVTSARK